ncbi:MAG: hypothetical protein AAGF75_04725 [Cyanobacteria bacterium P01_H01_bin.130]
MPPSESSTPQASTPIPPAVHQAIQRLAAEGIPTTLTLERLPLAVYREIVAQLQLLEILTITLLPQTSTEFDYLQSQVGGIQLCVNTDRHNPMDQSARQNLGDRLLIILKHYGDRFGPWSIIQ